MNNPTGSSAHRLLGEILTRYGSLEAFSAHLHALLDAPTVVLPIPVSAPPTRGRHRRRELPTTGPRAPWPDTARAVHALRDGVTLRGISGPAASSAC
ncbi:hypothetical protein [Nocardia aurantiaca]|uniref:Uncharacterized protein n=1 Tax=Nocardia aurantiaca TaxID=2675850 RepID=A0A6I3KVR6_9NOCA|nr:hypothetical protein [Nocardia aurantiaca]MTE14913.1 hypothetical protein [Nocardia aurantiaca]